MWNIILVKGLQKEGEKVSFHGRILHIHQVVDKDAYNEYK